MPISRPPSDWAAHTLLGQELWKQLEQYSDLIAWALSRRWVAAHSFDVFLKPHPNFADRAHTSPSDCLWALNASASAILVTLLHNDGSLALRAFEVNLEEESGPVYKGTVRFEVAKVT